MHQLCPLGFASCAFQQITPSGNHMCTPLGGAPFINAYEYTLVHKMGNKLNFHVIRTYKTCVYLVVMYMYGGNLGDIKHLYFNGRVIRLMVVFPSSQMTKFCFYDICIPRKSFLNNIPNHVCKMPQLDILAKLGSLPNALAPPMHLCIMYAL